MKRTRYGDSSIAKMTVDELQSGMPLNGATDNAIAKGAIIAKLPKPRRIQTDARRFENIMISAVVTAKAAIRKYTFIFLPI